ncbi:MAG: DUF882 domain-containing protein [Desulfobacterales bacterium]
MPFFSKKSTGIPTDLQLNRRKFIRLGVLAAAAAAFSPAHAVAAVSAGLEPKKNLSFFNTHTGESLDVCYCRKGVYPRQALKRIRHLLRDHRTGDTKTIDPRVLDILYRLSRRLDTAGPFHIISGYRSPATNAALHRKSLKVASRSFHMQGMAIDFRLPDRRTDTVHAAALDIQAGGVGYYPESDFVHVDCGPVRCW